MSKRYDGFRLLGAGLGMFAGVASAAPPVPEVLADGSVGDLSIPSTVELQLSVRLTPGEQLDVPADWWMLALTASGWQYFDLVDGWRDGVAATYRGRLFDLAGYPVLDGTLAPGVYTYYFGVDTLQNGALDLEYTTYSSLRVEVRSAASFEIVDTGQTADFSATPGEDSDYRINPPRYTAHGDGTVTDRVTGLMWTASADLNGDGTIDVGDKLTFDQAFERAAAVDVGGYVDWRLPSIKELYSLIDFSGRDPSGYEGASSDGLMPFIDTEYFGFAYGDTTAGERLIDAQYASSTLYVSNTGNDGGRTLFGVNFADGRIKGYGLVLAGQEKLFNVLYVRGNDAYGENNLVVNGDGTVTDGATKLMWARDDSGVGMDWEEALAWVAARNQEAYLGYADWRLPNAKELQSIVDYSRSPDTTGSAAIDPVFTLTAVVNEAGDTDYPYFWTSTTHEGWTGESGRSAVYVAFGRALGYMGNSWVDVHGAGAQRSDPKEGDANAYPTGFGPQGDAIRIDNFVRLVRSVD